jgi:hypothetical protein
VVTGLLHVLAGRPLTVHFSLVNPADSEHELRVPATVAPLVTLSVYDAAGPVYEQERPKLRLKLDPASAESYVVLQPGQTFGAVLTVAADDLWLEPGDYTVRAGFDPAPFEGSGCSAEASLSL